MRDRDWDSAEQVLSTSEFDCGQYSCLWRQRAQLAIKLGDYDSAERAVPAAQSLVHETSLAAHIRGRVAEARWRLDEAATYYKKALASNPQNPGVHADFARLSLKRLEIDDCRHHLRSMIDLDASSRQLKGQSPNVSQTHIGQLVDEFALDRTLLDELREVRALPLQQQVGHLKAIALRNPDHTPSAIMLLIAMRQAEELGGPPRPSSPDRVSEIPQRIFQFWDDASPPEEILELMDSWKARHPGFEYVRFDGGAARAFLIDHGLEDVLRAYWRARQPAQKADIIRLAYLAVKGGYYADADDRCLSAIPCFVPAQAAFVAIQEEFGTLGNNFLGATPRHAVMQLALRLATEAVNRGDADLLWLSTGPGLLTRAFSQLVARDDPASTPIPGAAIFERGRIERHIGIHCPGLYKRSHKHWSRSSFSKVTRRPPRPIHGTPMPPGGAVQPFGRAQAAFDARRASGANEASSKECEGWPKQGSPHRSSRGFSQPLWDGLESIYGKTILLHGDEDEAAAIQFCRYAPLLNRRGAHVILQVPERLRRLVESLPGGAHVVPPSQMPPAFDMHCPLSCLPLAFGTKLETVPSAVPYLRPPADAISAWKARLGPKERPRIGIAWAGAPQGGCADGAPATLSGFLSLAEVDATVVSLQMDLCASDVAMLRNNPRIVYFEDALHDVSDAAALTMNLDLVISADAGIAHVAGAIGIPVWILLPDTPDWPRIVGRNYSPWYPTARPFRQHQTGHWDSLIAQVKSELAERFGNGRGEQKPADAATCKENSPLAAQLQSKGPAQPGGAFFGD
jgi:hypothetical protein